HLRFRRNDVVRFLRAHSYPIPEELQHVRPALALAIAPPEDLAKKLAARFAVTSFDTAIGAIARLAAEEPDALVLSLDDPTFTGTAAILALKTDPSLAWLALVVVGRQSLHASSRDAGADLALAPDELGELPRLLAHALAVS